MSLNPAQRYIFSSILVRYLSGPQMESQETLTHSAMNISDLQQGDIMKTKTQPITNEEMTALWSGLKKWQENRKLDFYQKQRVI